MKRLAAQFGITYFTVLAAAFYMSDMLTAAVGAAALAAFAVFLIVKKLRKRAFLPVCAAAALIACIMNLGYSFLFVYPSVEKYSDGEHSVTATLSDEPYRSYSKFYYKLKTSVIDGEPVRLNILLKTRHSLDTEPDDTISFTAELSRIENNYYSSKGYYLVSYDDDTRYMITEAESHSLYYYAIKLRKYLRRSLESLIPEREASLCRAVFIGDKYALDLSERENFRYAGASYFIVVSGLHFAVLSLLVFRLFGLFRNRWITLTATVVFMLLYAFVTGFQPSVVRSGLMMLCTVIGRAVRRQTYPPNHLGIAGIVMPLILSPYSAGDIGLILSFYATLAILLWAEPIAKRICFKDKRGNILYFNIRRSIKALFGAVKRRIKKEKPADDSKESSPDRGLFFKKLWNCVGSVWSVSLAANILVFPISVFVFGEFSLVTLLSSLLLYIPIYLILLLSIFVCILYWLGPLKYIAILLSWPLYLLAKAVLAAVEFIAGLPFAFVRVGSAYIYIWLAVTVVLGAAVLVFRRRFRLMPYAALISAIVLLAGWLTNSLIDMNTLRLEVYSCGSGLFVGMNDRGRLHFLTADCGDRYSREIADRLLSRYGGADTAFGRNVDELDKYFGFAEDGFAISEYLLYDNVKREEDYPAAVTTFGSNSDFILDDDIVLSVDVSSGKPLYLLTAADKTVLIVPRSFKTADIPSKWRSADAIVLTSAAGADDSLSCGDLIISASEDKAEAIADSMENSCSGILYTYNGDISYDLR